MTQTESQNRVNANYRIVDSIYVGEAEFVLGVHTVCADMYSPATNVNDARRARRAPRASVFWIIRFGGHS